MPENLGTSVLIQPQKHATPRHKQTIRSDMEALEQWAAQVLYK